jgi:hypothetical protein
MPVTNIKTKVKQSTVEVKGKEKATICISQELGVLLSFKFKSFVFFGRKITEMAFSCM